MNSEIILETFEKRLLMQRYAGNTIRSYKDYASIFLKHVSKYPSLEEIPLSDIEAFINEKVQNGKTYTRNAHFLNYLNSFQKKK